MISELMTIADYAADTGGKMTIVGIFNVLRVNALPAVAPSISIAMRLKLEPSDIGPNPKSLEIRVTSPSGGKLVDIKAELPPATGAAQWIQFVANAQRLKLTEQGTHTARLTIDGKEIDTAHFDVRVKEGTQGVTTH